MSQPSVPPAPLPKQNKHLPKGLLILFEDKDLLVVDKGPGLLTVSTEREEERTAYFALTNYVRKGQAKSRNRIFVVHRLDRDTSGVLVFAKTPQAKEFLQSHWDRVHKTYLAVVFGSFEEKSATITSYLAENRAQVVHSTHDKVKGRIAHTAYRTLKETSQYSLLEVNILTGRKNQIRVHFSENGHPIVGDKKYGRASVKAPRMALHAYSIRFPHPTTGVSTTITSSIPPYFSKLVGGLDEPGETEAP